MFKLENKFYDKLSDILEPIEFVEKKKGLVYLNTPIAFDIEVSSFLENEEKRCTMYAFVFGINGKCILGRTWDDFKEIITNFIKYYKIDNKHRAIIFVHNLSYEFQFIKDMFEWTSLLCLEQRKVITATTNIGLEFRCSYLLSGLSLARVGENLIKYKVQKMVGGLDYKLIRHSFTPLTDKERGYILNDGLVVMAYIEEEIERLGNITKLPYTKTGYARNKCREYCFNGPSRSSYNNLIRRLTLTDETYTLINQA